ncbi:MAG TPA: hypothetical protein PK800_06625, partial [Syntrophorhabdaceae bacterium]|nr:hypothetical protein [Syntrophorhabdaceae bacterium]
MDEQIEATILLDGSFIIDNGKEITGKIFAITIRDYISILDEKKNTIYKAQEIRFKNRGDATFTVFDVSIGKTFHW